MDAAEISSGGANRPTSSVGLQQQAAEQILFNAQQSAKQKVPTSVWTLVRSPQEAQTSRLAAWACSSGEHSNSS
jgi:hypothetical protein